MKNDKKIRKKQLIAMDIGTNSIKIAVGRNDGKKINVKKIVTVKTPEKSITNGRIKDFAKIVEVIKKGLKDNGIKGQYAVVNVKSSSIINRELSLPFNEDKEALDRIVHYEMKQFLAIKLDMYVTQYQITDEYYEDKTKMVKVMVSCIEKEIVESYLTLLKEVGLKPYVFDVHFNTIGKVFWLYSEEVEFIEKSIAVVDIGYNSTDVTIVVDGQFKMSRTVESGSNVLEHMLEDEFNIHIRETHGNAIFNPNLPQIEERVKQTLDDLVEEVNHVTRFYKSRDSKNMVDEIYFTGGLARFDDVMDALCNSLQLKRFQFRNLSKMIQGLEENADFTSYITLIGALIRR
jgi:type IV pilus assembly protein PilM